MNPLSRWRSTPKAGTARSGLFVRIYVTLVVVIVGFVGLSSVAVWVLARSYSGAWTQDVGDHLFEQRERIIETMESASGRGGVGNAAHALSDELSDELSASVRVFPGFSPPRPRGPHHGPRSRPPGQPGAPPMDVNTHDDDIAFDEEAFHRAGRHRPPRGPKLSRHERGLLTRGQYAVRARAPLPPTVFWPALDEQGRVAAVVVVTAKRPRPGPATLLTGLLFLSALAGGVWWLARSLTSRLAALELSTRQLAAGQLAHRAIVPDGTARDEIDRLAFAFNDMAQRIEDLIKGQRRLLTNVSHELKTPLARIRVLVEMLGERSASWDVRGDPQLARVSRGLRDMVDDLDEIEALVQDLLTSGRLELGESAVLRRSEVDLCKLCRRVAGRHAATASCVEPLHLFADELLLERLLSNLLGNARRACPTGEVAIDVRREGDDVMLQVSDEGPGISVADREMIFDPFTRLDAARNRASGGIGLGLFMCRQIAQVHGGSISVGERADGRSGAVFVIRLPIEPDAEPAQLPPAAQTSR